MVENATDRASNFRDRVRRVFQILRYGRKEQILFLIAFLLLALPSLLSKWSIVPETIKQDLDWFYVLPIILIALGIWRMWRQSIPPPIVVDEAPKPTAIKGPLAFGAQDGELFAKLYRGEEGRKLLSWILDDQVPLGVVMGESGCGKTSLLRAGLEYALTQDASNPIIPIYWEALPTNPESGLLRAVQRKWETEEKPPESLHELVNYAGRQKLVIIIDQAEQLSPERHPAFFEVLKSVVQQSPPYQTTWVIAFRREYDPTWRDFELSIPNFHPPMLSLKRFTVERAKAIMAILAHESNLTPEDKVVTQIVKAVTVNGAVSPVDIGISMLVLSELATGSHAQVSDVVFRMAGGEEGLLALYIEKRLERFRENERQPMMQALLYLIDLETNQRVAEGRKIEELVPVAGLPVSKVRANVDYLASSQVRLLEPLPPPPQKPEAYRLAHERLIPALRRLTGVLLAAAEQARLLLNRHYRVWARDRRAKLLLSGGELRKVLKFREQFRWGEDRKQKQEFVRQSQRRRNIRYALGIGAFALVVGVGGTVWNSLQAEIQAGKYREALLAWGFPGDLYDRQGQLDSLEIRGPIRNTDWIEEGIKRLSLRGLQIDSTEGLHLPSSLESLTLSLSGSQVSRLEGLSSLSSLKSLTLDLEFSRVMLGGLSSLSSLKSLALDLSFSGASGVEALLSLSSLESLTLDLSFSGASSVEALSSLSSLSSLKNLTLYLRGFQVSSVEVLSSLSSLSSLESLTLSLSPFQVSSLARIIHNSHRWGVPGSIRLIRSRLLALKALAEAQIPDGAPKRASKTSSQVLNNANKI